jgi:hypothetical protein
MVAAIAAAIIVAGLAAVLLIDMQAAPDASGRSAPQATSWEFHRG